MLAEGVQSVSKAKGKEMHDELRDLKTCSSSSNIDSKVQLLRPGHWYKRAVKQIGDALGAVPQTQNIDWTGCSLADTVSKKGLSHVRKPYPGSVAAEYAARQRPVGCPKTKRFDEITFCDIIRHRAQSVHPLPSADTPVVHLRLGDVLEHGMQLNEVEDAFKYGISIVPKQIRNMVGPFTLVGAFTLGRWHYVKSECAYKAILNLLPTTMRKVSIVISAHHGVVKNRGCSEAYLALVKQCFERAGLVVDTRSDALPDEDMIWMSHAASFIGSVGGVSSYSLANTCVKALDGLALDDSFAEAVASYNTQDSPRSRCEITLGSCEIGEVTAANGTTSESRLEMKQLYTNPPRLKQCTRGI